MRKDLYSNIGLALALSPAVQAAAVSGVAVDLKEFASALVVVNTGAIVGAGDFGAKLQHSDTSTSGDFVDVPAADVKTNAPATLAADTSYKLGYIGKKRFLRIALTKAGGTSIAADAVVIKGTPALAPVA
ncbi:hypothetical protein OE766_05400 [Pararhizobium sp. YC-54]|uniref:hypothetical protein n=1 Tax=Pararhizobium sp. YC-54 TaxID=2986920 RepID=UPI0021F75B39|nr:hypothetical protein [Pararhizobium sp. YC-54]MCV9997675.1 hypothetical protein [Pararhizobium sp. YC-54]